ncbi:MAG: PEP-CTERM sorting domain-containing protein [Fimbriimonadaceae bacterium]|nr:PEP-CTERM sorting domain-containing protein [Fimbriimonadaceae bacterium]QYK58304.1 MAG: PEP-CTERM sorting domain-containing protein [Fimbriimonadaceae bacterium]
MHKNLLILAGVVAMAGANAQSLYNNAIPAGLADEGLRTGSRPAGGSYSECQLTNTTAGWSAGFAATGLYFRLADDFSVGGPGWVVNSITVWAYNTGATTPTITAGNMVIRSGSVNGGVAATAASFTNNGFTDIYRIFNGQPGDTRRVQKLTFTFNADVLAAGNYWIDYSLTNVAGSLNPFNPSLTKVGATNTPGANAQQFNPTTGLWTSVIDTGSSTVQDLPFWIDGQVVPEPGTMIALGAGLAALAARRRRK